MNPWVRWLEEQIAAHQGRVRNLALAAGIAESKLSRWRYGHLLPTATDQMVLARVTGTPLETIIRLVWDASRERALAREARLHPPVGTAIPAAAPSPKRPLRAASRPPRAVRPRRRLLVWLVALGSVGRLLGPLPGVEARPITDGLGGGILSPRRNWRPRWA